MKTTKSIHFTLLQILMNF